MDLVFVLKWVKSFIACALYIFHISLIECLLRRVHTNRVKRSRIGQFKAHSHYCVFRVRLRQTVALLRRDRKIPISVLTQSTVESADCCGECEWAFNAHVKCAQREKSLSYCVNACNLCRSEWVVRNLLQKLSKIVQISSNKSLLFCQLMKQNIIKIMNWEFKK